MRKRRPEFLELNPAGTTPVLVDGNFPVSNASVIAEYLDETQGSALGSHRLLPAEPKARAETRRIANWFNEKFFTEVSEPLAREKIFKLRLSSGGRRRAARFRRSASSAQEYPLSSAIYRLAAHDAKLARRRR